MSCTQFKVFAKTIGGIMTQENLEKELKEGKLNSIYLFYGEELFLLENAVKKMKKLFGEIILGINYIQIDETNINSLISNIETPAFGFDKKPTSIKTPGTFILFSKYRLLSFLYFLKLPKFFLNSF